MVPGRSSYTLGSGMARSVNSRQRFNGLSTRRRFFAMKTRLHGGAIAAVSMNCHEPCCFAVPLTPYSRTERFSATTGRLASRSVDGAGDERSAERERREPADGAARERGGHERGARAAGERAHARRPVLLEDFPPLAVALGAALQRGDLAGVLVDGELVVDVLYAGHRTYHVNERFHLAREDVAPQADASVERGDFDRAGMRAVPAEFRAQAFDQHVVRCRAPA